MSQVQPRIQSEELANSRAALDVVLYKHICFVVCMATLVFTRGKLKCFIARLQLVGHQR
jgi:hypothetical protein